MSFEVRHPEIEATLKDIGRTLKSQMPPGWGFTLFILNHDENEPNATFYLSSIERKGMIEALKEFIEKQEKLV